MSSYLKNTIIYIGVFCMPAAAVENLAPTITAKVTDVKMTPYSNALLGDWGGRRDNMLARGYDLQILYKLDLLSNSSVARDKVFGLDNLDIKLNVDFEKINGSGNTSAFLHIISNRGDKPAVNSDRLPHGMDNIETPVNGNTTKLFQAWIQQKFLEERISVLAGLYDLNSEFYATESAAIFIHPTFGMSAELAGTGKNGPSIFPTSSFGIRLKIEPVPGYYLQAITLDGIPGDPKNPEGTYIKFNGAMAH